MGFAAGDPGNITGMKKKMLVTFTSSFVLLVLMAAPAFAEYAPGGVNTPPQVAPNVLEAPRSLAFTGSQVIVPLVLVAIALFGLGAALVAVSRRVRGTSVTE
jgi:hypothetical protein